MDAQRQIPRPSDDAVRRLAFRDDLGTSHDLPSGREFRRSRELGPRRPPGPDDDRTADERPRDLRRQGIENNFERSGIRHTAVTLTVQEFGLNSLAFGLSEKIQAARGLHANA